MCVRMWHKSSSLEAINASHGFSIDMVIQLRLSCSDTISILIWLRSLNIHLTLRSEYLFLWSYHKTYQVPDNGKALEIVRTGLISAEVLLNVFEFGLFVFIIQKEWSGMFFIFIFILFMGSALPHSSPTPNSTTPHYKNHIRLQIIASHYILSYNTILCLTTPHNDTSHSTHTISDTQYTTSYTPHSTG